MFIYKRSMRILWFIGALLCGMVMHAQNLLNSGRQAAEGQVFELTNVDARRLAMRETGQISEAWLQDLVTRFPSKQNLPSELPPGQYVSTKIVGNQLTWTYLQVPNCDVFAENDHEHLMLRVIDLEGNVVTDALVKVGKEILPYDAQTQTYLADKHKADHFVEIEVGGHVQFFDLKEVAAARQGRDDQYHPPFLKRFIANPLQGWVLKPIVLTLRLPYDLVLSVVKRRLYGWPALIATRMQQVAMLSRKIVHGGNPVTFVVCSQPRYRPGDTVQVKAYLTEKGGAPLRTKLDIYLTDKHGQPRRAAQMQRIRPGAYTASFVLTDSLELLLDRTIPLSIEHRRSRKNVAQTQFHYEDYELDEFGLHVRLASATHWQGKPAVLYVEAKDMNHLTVPDARARITVTSINLKKWQPRRIFIPDTLWTWAGNLDAAGETRIEIPLAQLPPAALNYQVQVECWSSDNEYKKDIQIINYLHDIGEIKLVQKGLILEAGYWVNGESVPHAGEMTIYTGALLGRPAEAIQFPFQIQLSPAWGMITFKAGDVTTIWSGLNGQADLQALGSHTGDSLKVDASSKAGIAFTWHLFEGNHEIASGPGPLHYQAAAKARVAYHLNVHGTFGGQPFCEDYTYNCPINVLNLVWDGPETVYPGMTADMQVQVHDRRGRPVRKADLTAYAVNGRFEGAGRPNVSVRATKVKARQMRNDHALSAIASTGAIGSQLPLQYPQWVQRARLDTLAWYQFLYPGGHIYTYRHPIEPDHAEFAPFVVKDGAIQPVQIIYLDGDPIYFAWSKPATPYSFWADAGKRHRVELRLPDCAVVFDSMVIQQGFKTILSMDMGSHVPHVLQRPLPATVQPNEQSIIASHSFAYRNAERRGPSIITFGPDRVFSLEYGNGLSGPAKPNFPMTLAYANAYSHTINFESNFEFDFGPKTVKMRTYASGNFPQELNFNTLQDVAARPWVRDSLVNQWLREKNRPAMRRAPLWSRYDGPNFGRVLLERGPASANLPNVQALILHDPKRHLVYVLRLGQGGEVRVPLGHWQMHLLLDGGRYVAIDSGEVLPRGRNYIPLDYEAKDVQDSLPAFIDKLIEYGPPTETYDNPTAFNAANGTRNFRHDSNRPRSGRKTHVRGRVVDFETGDPLPAVMIFCQGFGVGVYSDFDGQFEIDVPVETDTILVHSLGYRNAFVVWKGQTFIDVRMEEGYVLLETINVNESRHYSESLSSTALVKNMDKSVTTIGRSEISGLTIRGGRDVAQTVIPGVLAGSNDGRSSTDLVPEFPEELLAELGNAAVMRKAFRDHAIWEPALRTDRAGQSTFRVHFPDDITRWDAYAVAIDRRGRAGMTQAMIKSWKPLAGRLAIPRFLMEGDTCLVIGKVLNYTGDTLSVRRRFQVNGMEEAHVGECGPVQLDTLQLVAPRGTDSLTLSYRADRPDGYGDGEERGIGIFPVGIVDARGTLAALPGDTTLQLAPFASDGGPVKIFATTRFQELLLVETRRLQNYNHLCNEQLSSKLIGLLSEEIIFKSLDRPWHGKKDIEACIRLLVKRIAPADNGLAWGWWPGMRAELWVSTHVTQALLMARAQGYAVQLQMLDWIPGLMNRLQLKQHYYPDNIDALELIQFVAPELDITSKIAALDTLRYSDVTQQIAIMELRQKAGMSIDIDSLDRLMGRTLDRAGQYRNGLRSNYVSNYSAYQPVYCPTEALLGAYRIKRHAGQGQKALAPLLLAILDSRSVYGWSNTFETAQVLLTLVPDIGTKAFTERPRLTMVMDGQRQALPMDSAVTLDKAPTNMRVEKTGYGLVFFTAYQRFFNAQPQPADSLFALKTEFFTKDKLKPSDQIQAGEPLTMRVHLHVKRSMDYLMVEIPIPAGCSYGPKTQGYATYGGYGVYREYFREKVACYYRQLSAGNYVIDIPLQPKYSGKYVLNCARAEQMYMPLLCGQNAVRRVSIQ
jgi:alpha-2-macroglobulin